MPQLLAASGLGSSSDWQDYQNVEGGAIAQTPLAQCPEVGGNGIAQAHHPLGDYGFNWGYVTLKARSIQLNRFTRPEKTLLCIDAADGPDETSEWFVHNPVDHPDWDGNGMIDMRHLGKGNVLFLDGHAETMKRSDVWGNVDDIWLHDTPVN